MNAPTLDPQILQEKANEFALEGALKTIKEFYTGYESPFKKQLKEMLEKSPVPYNFELPDIIATLNQSISNEIDLIANQAISKTYGPLVKEFLTRAEPEIKFSEFLTELIKDLYIEKIEDLELDMELDPEYGWYRIELRTEDTTWNITLHVFQKKDEQKKYYQFLSLPRNMESRRMMTLSVDNIRLEIPFTPDVIKDPVCRAIARYIISETKIIVDTTELTDEMFPERCHC